MVDGFGDVGRDEVVCECIEANCTLVKFLGLEPEPASRPAKSLIALEAAQHSLVVRTVAFWCIQTADSDSLAENSAASPTKGYRCTSGLLRMPSPLNPWSTDGVL